MRITAALTHKLFAQEAVQGIKYTSYDMLTLRDIIEKPFQPEELLSRIRGLFDLGR